MWCSCCLILIQRQGGHQSDFGRRADLFLHLGHENESGGDSSTQCSILVFSVAPFLSRITSVPQKSMFFAFWRGEYHISRIWQFRLNRTYHESLFFWSSRYIKVQSVLKLQVQTIHRLPGCWYIISKIFSIISIHLCHVSAKCASKPTSRSALRVLSSQILG